MFLPLIRKISVFTFLIPLLYLANLQAVFAYSRLQLCYHDQLLRKSYQACGNGLICNDNGANIGYCCTANLNRCCSYVGAWKLWYFWVSIVLCVGMFFACIACTRRLLARIARQEIDEDRGSENHNFVPDDLPPSYQQVEMEELRQSEHLPLSDTSSSAPPYEEPSTHDSEEQ